MRSGTRRAGGAATGPASGPAVRAVMASALAACAVLLGAAPAQAEGYRYWSFWDRDGGSWTYATQGPSTARPANGDVQGFRFSVSADSRDAARPRTAPDFDAVCGGTPAKDGTKRVALVLDFGTAADAPAGETPPKPRTECARVPADASSGEALAAVAEPLRYNSSALLCAIAGYPRSGCGEQVSGEQPGTADSGERGESDASGERTPEDGGSGSGSDSGSSGPSVGLYAGIAAVAGLGAAAVWQARRRR